MRGDAGLFVDERLERLYRYWCRRRQGRVAPRRADIDPADIPGLLPIVSLIDVLPGTPRFRHRLVGTEVADRAGRDMTGRYVVEEHYGADTAAVILALATVADQVRPYRQIGWQDWPARTWQSVDSIQLPLIDDAGRCHMLLTGTSVVSRHGPRLCGSEFHPLPVLTVV